MKKRQFIHATSYGAVYRFSPRAWKKLLRDLAGGAAVHYVDYGKLVLVVDHNITDLDQEQAALLLEEL